MSVSLRVYCCDWPNCSNNIEVDGGIASLHTAGWEGGLFGDSGRPSLHVCPAHARRSERDLLEEWIKETL